MTGKSMESFLKLNFDYELERVREKLASDKDFTELDHSLMRNLTRWQLDGDIYVYFDTQVRLGNISTHIVSSKLEDIENRLDVLVAEDVRLRRPRNYSFQNGEIVILNLL